MQHLFPSTSCEKISGSSFLCKLMFSKPYYLKTRFIFYTGLMDCMYSVAEIYDPAFMVIHSTATSDFAHYLVLCEYYKLHFKGLILA